MADVYSADFKAFNTGDIITESQALEKWDTWFGYPYGLAETFIMKTTVSDTNEFLQAFKIPWRVTAVNVVSGVRQWTIA